MPAINRIHGSPRSASFLTLLVFFRNIHVLASALVSIDLLFERLLTELLRRL
jgi:hypothetical protein